MVAPPSQTRGFINFAIRSTLLAAEYAEMRERETERQRGSLDFSRAFYTDVDAESVVKSPPPQFPRGGYECRIYGYPEFHARIKRCTLRFADILSISEAAGKIRPANFHDAIAGDGKSRMREKRITSARDETKMDICKNEVGKYAEADEPTGADPLRGFSGRRQSLTRREGELESESAPFDILIRECDASSTRWRFVFRDERKRMRRADRVWVRAYRMIGI